jgi:hypothetical protein
MFSLATFQLHRFPLYMEIFPPLLQDLKCPEIEEGSVLLWSFVTVVPVETQQVELVHRVPDYVLFV